MAKIKPCPFCGQSAQVTLGDNGTYRVRCDTPACASKYSYFTKEMAIKEWNTRTKPRKENQNG